MAPETAPIAAPIAAAAATITQRRLTLAVLGCAAAALALPPAQAASETPDALIARLSTEVLDALRQDKTLKAGEIADLIALVDKTVMPHVNFRRMTASAVGPQWRQATPAQQSALQQEFKTLLVRTYAGALTQVNQQSINVKPLRARPEDTDVLVRTLIEGRGEPIQLDYRLEKSAGGDWKIYNLNVLGIWLVETYRNQFTQEINAKGIDGLIATLTARNSAQKNP